MKIRIATRKSELAIWQANHVASMLTQRSDIENVELIPLSTKGDRALDASLQKIGGKGLFTKELETAMLHDNADIAVHSMKDIPVEIPDEFCIAAMLKRESPFDSLISKKNHKLRELETNSIIGSSSLRRKAQILNIRPDLKIKDIRGNVDTRLDKLDGGEFDAIILARAAMERLGLSGRITETFSPKDMLPAAGQGVLGIECLADRRDLISLLDDLTDTESKQTTLAERSFNKELHATCQSPIGAYAIIEDNKCKLEAIIATPDGSKIIRESMICDIKETTNLGENLANHVKTLGANDILNPPKI